MLHSANLIVSRSGTPPLSFPDLSISKGENNLLLGPSGSGKTTLLSVIAGLLPPSSGHVMWEGQDIYQLSARRRDALRSQNFGFIFQSLHLLPSLTVRQNIALAASMAKVNAAHERIDYLLTRLGLSDKAGCKPETLSQGEIQRAAIARAVLLRPRLIIADEPTSALDDDNAASVMSLLEDQAKETGAALFIATHDSRIIARFSKIIRLDHPTQAAA